MRESFAIASERFSGTRSFDSIAEKIHEVHDKFGLDYKKKTHTVTDNASKFAKAFCEFGFKERNENDDQENSEGEVNFYYYFYYYYLCQTQQRSIITRKTKTHKQIYQAQHKA